MLDHPRAPGEGVWPGYTVTNRHAPRREDIGGFIRTLQPLVEGLVTNPPTHGGEAVIDGRAVIEVTGKRSYGLYEGRPSQEALAALATDLVAHARANTSLDVVGLSVRPYAGDGGMWFEITLRLAQPEAAKQDQMGGPEASGALPPLMAVGLPPAGNRLALLTQTKAAAGNGLTWNELQARSNTSVVAGGLVETFAAPLVAYLAGGGRAREVNVRCQRWDFDVLQSGHREGIEAARAEIVKQLQAVAPELTSVGFGARDYNSESERRTVRVHLRYANEE